MNKVKLFAIIAITLFHAQIQYGSTYPETPRIASRSSSTGCTPERFSASPFDPRITPEQPIKYSPEMEKEIETVVHVTKIIEQKKLSLGRPASSENFEVSKFTSPIGNSLQQTASEEIPSPSPSPRNPEVSTEYDAQIKHLIKQFEKSGYQINDRLIIGRDARELLDEYTLAKTTLLSVLNLLNKKYFNGAQKSDSDIGTINFITKVTPNIDKKIAYTKQIITDTYIGQNLTSFEKHMNQANNLLLSNENPNEIADCYKRCLESLTSALRLFNQKYPNGSITSSQDKDIINHIEKTIENINRKLYRTLQIAAEDSQQSSSEDDDSSDQDSE